MTITFTEEEKKYLDPNETSFTIVQNCPEDIKKRIEMKIKRIKDYGKENEK